MQKILKREQGRANTGVLMRPLRKRFKGIGVSLILTEWSSFYKLVRQLFKLKSGKPWGSFYHSHTKRGFDQLTFGTSCSMTNPAEPSLHEQCRYASEPVRRRSSAAGTQSLCLTCRTRRLLPLSKASDILSSVSCAGHILHLQNHKSRFPSERPYRQNCDHIG